MQAARRITDEHIHISGLGGGDAIIHHRGGVGALGVLYHLAAYPFRPDAQLLTGRRPEGIRRTQQHLFALALQPIGQLADGGGLAHPVDADHQHHAGLGLRHQRLIRLHQLGHDLAEILP